MSPVKNQKAMFNFSPLTTRTSRLSPPYAFSQRKCLSCFDTVTEMNRSNIYYHNLEEVVW